jgi:membrane-bound lytic murein transglycosylase B
MNPGGLRVMSIRFARPPSFSRHLRSTKVWPLLRSSPAGQTDGADILRTFSVASFVGKGAALEGAALTHPGPPALIELRNGSNPPSYVTGTENFYAITRDNWSSYYALPVIELGKSVQQAIKQPSASK